MFSVSFIFRPGAYDEEFHRLDAATQAIAEATKGFLGSEAWWSDDRAVCNAVYYWEDRRQLAVYARAIPHRAAKARYDRWYDGYPGILTAVPEPRWLGAAAGLAATSTGTATGLGSAATGTSGSA